MPDLVMYLIYGGVIIMCALVCSAILSRYRIRTIYRKYMQVGNKSDLSGKQLAAISIAKLDLPDLKLAVTDGELTDAYSPKHRTLIMSREVCDSASIASLAIVAHELGHAVQHRQNNRLFGLCQILGRITAFTNKFVFPLLIVGFFMYMFKVEQEIALTLLYISFGFFIAQIVCKLITIPMEMDASKKALTYLRENGFVSKSELRQAKRLLRVAGQTYFSSLFNGFFVMGGRIKRLMNTNQRSSKRK